MSFRYAPVSIAGTTVGKACAPVALVLAIFVLLTTASAAAAADPTGAVAPEGATAPAGQPLDDHELSILNAADEAILAMKLERAHQIEVASATSDAAFAAQATSIDSLHTYARQQANGYYCGPASV